MCGVGRVRNHRHVHEIGGRHIHIGCAIDEWHHLVLRRLSPVQRGGRAHVPVRGAEAGSEERMTEFVTACGSDTAFRSASLRDSDPDPGDAG